MLRKAIAAALAVAAVVVVANVSADSRPRHHHRHWRVSQLHRHHHVHRRHYVRRRHVRRYAAVNPVNPRGGVSEIFSGLLQGGAHGMESVINIGRQTLGAGASQLGLRRTLWCAAWVNKMLARVGLRGTGSDAAISFARWGKPSGPVRGAIMVMPHHVGVVTGSCGPGSVRLLSGNHGHRVGEGCYSIRRAVAFRSA
jgi:uncharacterized protein (TIGR02594 family)